MEISLGTRVRAIQDTHCVKVGDTGVYTRGDDYVPGWDAGIFEVTFDNPRTRQLAQAHWTLQELLTYWEPVA